MQTTYQSFIKGPEEDNTVPVKSKTFSTNIKDRFSLKGKVTVVTGGLGGIGRAICIGYAQMGGDVAIMDYARDGGEFSAQLQSQWGIRSKSYRLDATASDAVKAAVESVIGDFGTIDVFVANAGLPWYKGTVISESATVEDWHKMMDINLNSIFYCAKYVGKHFEQQQKGSFVITASMSAHIVNIPQYKAAYNVSKAGAMHLAKSLAVEWAGFARCNSVSPGYTDTILSSPVPTEDRAKWWGLTPMGREAHPEELVGAYVYLASDASSFTTGTDIRVDGGYTLI
ncbi:NAD(P)-dependent dehydrogenase [Yamadazyma tenuis]|uniref:NAD(P)-binding protein n=1 Tax=Candida tenuis (strain ATCC 10573 / BCRC 21748 / CBS 615 / JCM 9827 / NBRC 10315 / NRRL Y-1498 / VKM Y-70) TaxID=590646 RepID=G3B454_CANTC|nr:NAD(P)-binding protein [Yamadazyma tenuis ATCC 10573]XP_006686558.1 uncharacterized protein CANTEDRAFT_113822 [Yamadazyma tenuis ATCC 10573]EGV64243.1 NAD(P)-binding protein [Yamadazyma tenuis ATCC 10573]EGV64244.1 hypothetical protein CANTEDRAFT_113822 [Yamadazyma tenuis ATCC 10573]WEJ96608.1 NAD(P)-dependent dehydrogenase [Yamadazyma tenuis]